MHADASKHYVGWDTHELYQCSYDSFNVEWTKYYNQAEGRDQIMFVYKDEETNKIIKYRTLR